MLPHLSFFFNFPDLSPPLSFPLRTDPLRFQAGCHKGRLNLALALFRVVAHLFRLVNARAFVLLGLVFFPYQAKRMASGERLGNDAFYVEWDVSQARVEGL